MPRKTFHTLSFIKQSTLVMQDNKHLYIFPITSTILCTVLITLFGLVIAQVERVQFHLNHIVWHKIIWLYIALLIVLSFLHLIIFIMNAALIHCIKQYFDTGKSTLADGYKILPKLFWRLALWNIFSSTVGIAITLFYDSMIQWRWVNNVLNGLHWLPATTLIQPVITLENNSMLDSAKRSSQLVVDQWGPSVRINFAFRFGCAASLLKLLSALPLIITLFIGGANAIIVGFSLTAFFEMLIKTVLSSAQTVTSTALYIYAKDKVIPKHFDESIQQAFIATEN